MSPYSPGRVGEGCLLTSITNCFAGIRVQATTFCWGTPIHKQYPCEISYHSDFSMHKCVSFLKGADYSHLQLTRWRLVVGDVYKAIWSWDRSAHYKLWWRISYMLIQCILKMYDFCITRWYYSRLSRGKSVLDLPTPRFDAGRAFMMLGDTPSPLVSFVRFLLISVECCWSGG